MKQTQFDETLPQKLKETQIWFAGILTQPLVNGFKIPRIAPSGKKIELEAKNYITPGPVLKSHERIELYAQQYWWRLIKIMQDIYPFVTRLFGSVDFNSTLAAPYLHKYPPNDWSLNVLGRRFPQWLEDHYKAKDKQLVIDAAAVDNAFNESFLAANEIPLNDEIPQSGDMNEIVDKKLQLQKHVHLFKLPYNIFLFRESMLKESADYWIEHDFPELPKGATFYRILYRTHHNDVAWAEIAPNEYQLLTLFQTGSSIEEVCEYLETQPEEVYQDSAENLGNWFQKWVALRLLSLVK
jgi:hypothetical protein